MYGILLSAANAIFGYVLRSVIVKFFLYFALYLFVTEAVSHLQSAHLLPSASSLNVFGSIGDSVWYFLDLCSFSVGAPMIVSAYVTRFIIRRIPLIG
jgi:hypothetical protein